MRQRVATNHAVSHGGHVQPTLHQRQQSKLNTNDLNDLSFIGAELLRKPELLWPES